MLGMEEILCELEEEGGGGPLPPGFRFHPTDEELITFYLASKVFNAANNNITTTPIQIAEVDLNRCEPWELPDAAKMGEREWYFFSLRDRKYPTGLRTNRATGAGYWKATGKDREVYSTTTTTTTGGGGGQQQLLGMKKTLVFYKGRAPRGEKTKWVMHEYRLDGHFSCRHTGKEEWVICRIFHKIGDNKLKINPTNTNTNTNTTIFLDHQNYIFPNNSLPPLLDPQPPPPPLLESQSHEDNYPTLIMQTLNHNQNLQNPFLINNNQEDDYPSQLKTLINPLNILHPSSSDNNLHKRPFLVPNQDFTFRELSNAIAKQCKKEAASSSFDNELAHFQLLSGGGNNAYKWAGSPNYSHQDCSSPFLFGEMGGGGGLIPTQPPFKYWW